MTYKLPDWTLSKSLHLLLDLYERDTAAAHSLLSQDLGFGYLDDDLRRVPLTEQLDLLRRASKSSREEILRKTLIQTEGGTVRHTLIAEYVATPERIPDLYKDPDNQGYGLFDDVIAGIAAEQGLSYGEYMAASVREKLTEKKIEAELLRFFADRIEQITNAIEQFDDTAFDQLIPPALAAPFRELHINAILGNYGTALILCGAVLERTLKDLLPSTSLLNELIKEAKVDGLLNGHDNRSADRIRDDRNDVVHGRVGFDSVTSDHAWETIGCTRKLVSALYKDRL